MANRYVTAGMIADATSGKRVLYIAGTQRSAQHAFVAIMGSIDEGTVTRVVRSTGRLEIVLASGGWIRLISIRASGRGVSADVVFVDHEADYEASRNLYADIFPIVSPRGGEVIRS